MVAVQRARAQAAIPEEEEEEDADFSGEEDGEALPEMKLPGKIGTKKLKRIQEKAEKKAMREQEEMAREDRKRREALREEERKSEEENRKLQQEREEAERQKQKEEQERREHEEYLQLKEAFIVEEEGEGVEEEEEGARGLRDFIDYIKKTKVVFLEDLATEFNMKTQAAISRVQDLQESGELTGVVDDRGKFIYISPEELQAVAKFIRQRGRISISELVSSSNTLVNLQPDSPPVH